jgi:phosphoenolpyruvate-protein phosphotransferase
MRVLKGIGIFKGIAFGKFKMFRRNTLGVIKKTIENAQKETNRYKAANETAITELKSLYQKALQAVGEEEANIFQMHQMMLEDIDFVSSIENNIKEKMVNAEYAVQEACEKFTEMFSSMDDAYMKERAADIKDISGRLISVLTNRKHGNINSNLSCIIGADDLTPSETMQMDKSNVRGFVTIHGSSNSHTAILARTMNIPAVVGLGNQLKPEYEGCEMVVDGFSGTVYINPDITTVKRLKKKKELCQHQKELLQNLKGHANVTKDGKTIDIYANVGSPSDLDGVIKNDAGGVGLFRSEFLYLRRSDYPSEEEQFEIYKEAAMKMNGKRIIIRTMDIGADKKADYFDLPSEANPAMGYRAIRICLDRPLIFKTQLRAIYRASAFGKISLMFPMIISREEVIRAKEIAREVRESLDRENIAYDSGVQIGVMIETPAAVMISDELAKEVDFFSIGTNDLTQYSLAIDRQNNKISSMYNPYHKAILRMIKIVVDNAHKNGIWVGICGELAADETLTGVFLAMGVDELSMSAPFVLGVRKRMLEINVDEIKEQVLKEISF